MYLFILKEKAKLNSKFFRAVIASVATGASGSMQNITQADLLKIRIGLPPVEEQLKVVSYLGDQAEEIGKTAKSIKDAIDRLKEYRSALITNAVTGKIKVA